MIDETSVLYRTSVHEAGHVAFALAYDFVVTGVQLASPTAGETGTEHADPALTPFRRYKEHLYRTVGALAAAGNIAVSIILGQQAATAELADAASLPEVDANRMEAAANGVAALIEGDAAALIDSFKTEAYEVLTYEGFAEAVRRVAGVIYDTPIGIAIPGDDLVAAFNAVD